MRLEFHRIRLSIGVASGWTGWFQTCNFSWKFSWKFTLKFSLKSVRNRTYTVWLAGRNARTAFEFHRFSVPQCAFQCVRRIAQHCPVVFSSSSSSAFVDTVDNLTRPLRTPLKGNASWCSSYVRLLILFTRRRWCLVRSGKHFESRQLRFPHSF